MFAGFVDAGFLKAQGARAIKAQVRDLHVDAQRLVGWMRTLVSDHKDELLRVYWYDGAFDPSDQRFASQRRFFDAIEDTPGVKLRLGYLVERTPGWQYAVRKAVEACGVSLTTSERHYTFKTDLVQKGVDALLDP